ncbi:unnamed protein product [Mytilus coruscus]|uniref:Uncharacterized protein n=1 Tax=Mytilus coruscus TaxID=42192 RepID=A0A6J8DK24_MYTCO|nr:unnamed protein product [Mytilus coruscus]
MDKVKSKHTCLQCVKCGSTNSGRWYHNTCKPPDYLQWLNNMFNIRSDDCMCNACNIKMAKSFSGKPSCKRQKTDLCQLCDSVGQLNLTINDMSKFLDVMEEHIIESPTNLTKVLLCESHYKKWRDSRHFVSIACRDTVDSYSGSSKLSTILNSFGILSSKIKCRQHVSAIVEEKISMKFLEDLDQAAFTVVSIDNIDVGQPHASAKINDPQRGIHCYIVPGSTA